MLDKNILDEIEKRIEQTRNKDRKLTVAERDREYLYIQLQEVIQNSLLEFLGVPKELRLDG